MNMDGPIALLALILWVATLFVFFRMGADIKRIRELAERDAAHRYPPGEKPKRDAVAEEWAREQERKAVRIRIAVEEAEREKLAERRFAEMQARKTGEYQRDEGS